jgi:3-phosphoshikimate 1-carboxyvinyltransferase
LHAGAVQTYADHRMATFAAVLGLRVPDIEIVDIETTVKTMPEFVDLWIGMLA